MLIIHLAWRPFIGDTLQVDLPLIYTNVYEGIFYFIYLVTESERKGTMKCKLEVTLI